MVDPWGMGLFNSGVRHSGYVFRYTFAGAGTYAVLDDQTSHRSTVSIPTILTPATGGTTTKFTVQACSAPAPAGFVYETEIKRPGATVLTFWKSCYTNAFTPDNGAGVYEFHSRLRRKVNGAAAGWSPGARITVS